MPNGNLSDYCIQAAFSTEEAANKYLVELAKINHDSPKIEKWELDSYQGAIARPVWIAYINPKTGEIKEGSQRFDWGKPTDVSPIRLYDIVEEFYKTEYSNIWLNRIFEKFAEGKTIQDCSGDLIRTCKKFKI